MGMSYEKAAVRFGHWVFLLAGIVGILEIVPLYFLEATLGRSQPPPIAHPEFYYGFVGVVLAWQIAFLIISRDPQRYVALMPAVFLEKLSDSRCLRATLWLSTTLQLPDFYAGRFRTRRLCAIRFAV